MPRRLYDWTLSKAESPHAIRILAAVAFVESSIFPIPPEILLIPLVLAAPTRAWWIAAVCTVWSVLGGMAGYAIGYMAFEEIGRPLLDFYGKVDYFEAFKIKYNEWGAWAVLVAGVTPFPYKVITITSGATQFDLAVFTISSIVARGARFFIVAALLWKFGPPIRAFIEERFGLMTVIFFTALTGGFVVLKYLL